MHVVHPVELKREHQMGKALQRKLLTPKEVATMLRLDARTLRTLALPVIQLGKQYRYDELDVLALVDNKIMPTATSPASPIAGFKEKQP